MSNPYWDNMTGMIERQLSLSFFFSIFVFQSFFFLHIFHLLFSALHHFGCFSNQYFYLISHFFFLFRFLQLSFCMFITIIFWRLNFIFPISHFFTLFSSKLRLAFSLPNSLMKGWELLSKIYYSSTNIKNKINLKAMYYGSKKIKV